MRCLREAIRQKRTELWKNQSRILHYDNSPAHTSMSERKFLANNKNCIDGSTTTVFIGLGPCWLFPVRKTEDTDERKAFCYDLGEEAAGDTKKRVSKVFRGLEKLLAYIWGGLPWRGQHSYW